MDILNSPIVYENVDDSEVLVLDIDDGNGDDTEVLDIRLLLAPPDKDDPRSTYLPIHPSV